MMSLAFDDLHPAWRQYVESISIVLEKCDDVCNATTTRNGI